MRYLFRLPGKVDHWREAIATCRVCDEQMYSRQAMVWHAKRHVANGEAALANPRALIHRRYIVQKSASTHPTSREHDTDG